MLFLKVSEIIWLVKWRISDIVQSFHKLKCFIYFQKQHAIFKGFIFNITLTFKGLNSCILNQS